MRKPSPGSHKIVVNCSNLSMLSGQKRSALKRKSGLHGSKTVTGYDMISFNGEKGIELLVEKVGKGGGKSVRADEVITFVLSRE
jgi:hypothetical protein